MVGVNPLSRPTCPFLFCLGEKYNPFKYLIWDYSHEAKKQHQNGHLYCPLFHVQMCRFPSAAIQRKANHQKNLYSHFPVWHSKSCVPIEHPKKYLWPNPGSHSVMAVESYQAARSPGYRDGISHAMSNEDALLSCTFCLWVLFLWTSWMFTCHMAFLPSESTEANVGGDLNHVILGLWCSPTVCISQMGVLHYPLYLATEAIKPLSQAPSPHYRVVRCQELQKWVVWAL